MIENKDVLNLLQSWSGSSENQHHVLVLKKIITEFLQSKDHMKLAMLYTDHAMKVAANVLQSHILVVTESYNIDLEFYASCNPIISECFVLGLLNINGSKVYATVKQATKQG